MKETITFTVKLDLDTGLTEVRVSDPGSLHTADHLLCANRTQQEAVEFIGDYLDGVEAPA
jgi:hypothetical protein